MRSLLSIAFAVAATGLFCHGFFLEEEARKVLGSANTASDETFRKVQREHPFSQSAISAHEVRLDRWIKADRTPEGTPSAQLAWTRVCEGFTGEVPYVDPWGAAAIGLAGLALAVVLPGTRFRGLSLVALILGSASVAAHYMEPGTQVGIVKSLDAARHVLVQFPRIAIGLMFLAGLTLGFRSSPRRGG